jgi:hypothetical protein
MEPLSLRQSSDTAGHDWAATNVELSTSLEATVAKPL